MRPTIEPSPLLAIALLASAGIAQSFTSRTIFRQAGGSSPVLHESFDGFASGGAVSSLFSGLVTFQSARPTVFYGGWGAGCGSLVFSGGALIPEPRFQSKSLVMPFGRPVLGIGAQVFDDYDGNPGVATITLEVRTTTGATRSVSESCASTGDVGFLGIIATEGIVEAKFSINNSGGNLEVDEIDVLGLDQAAFVPFGSGCVGSIGTPALTATSGGVPKLGTTFKLAVGNVPQTALLAIGASNRAWGAVSLPLDGTPYGAPGCVLRVALHVALTASPSGGTAQYSLPIPNDAALVGAVSYAQAISLDASANRLGIAFSNAAVLVIGR